MSANLQVAVGDIVAERTVHLTRESLVRYAGASGDFNPIHYRDDIAASVGLPGVLAHGMLTMGLAVETIVPWLGDAGRDLVLVGLGMPAGIGKRHVGRRNRVDDERVDLALFLGFHPLVGVVGAVGAVAERDGAGDLCGEILDLEGCDFGGAAAAFQKPAPGHFGATAKR